MLKLEIGPLMQIDITSKVCRTDNVLDHLKQMLDKRFDRDRINEECKGMSVTTNYSKAGKHIYKVESIDFDKSIRDEFERKEGKISFQDYFEKQYKL